MNIFPTAMHVPLVVLTPNLTRIIPGLYSFHLLNGIWNSAAPGFNEGSPDVTADFHGLVDAHRFEDQGQRWVIVGYYELIGEAIINVGLRKVLIAPFWTKHAALLAMQRINLAVEVMFTGEAPKGAKVDLRSVVDTGKPQLGDKDTRVVNIDPPTPASS